MSGDFECLISREARGACKTLWNWELQTVVNCRVYVLENEPEFSGRASSALPLAREKEILSCIDCQKLLRGRPGVTFLKVSIPRKVRSDLREALKN